MGWDVWLEDIETGESKNNDSWNFTHNCNRMMSLAGLDLSRLNKASPAIAEKAIKDALYFLVLHREECETMNPANGWGDYVGLVSFLQKIYIACKKEAFRVNTPSNYILRVGG